MGCGTSQDDQPPTERKGRGSFEDEPAQEAAGSRNPLSGSGGRNPVREGTDDGLAEDQLLGIAPQHEHSETSSTAPSHLSVPSLSTSTTTGGSRSRRSTSEKSFTLVIGGKVPPGAISSSSSPLHDVPNTTISSGQTLLDTQSGGCSSGSEGEGGSIVSDALPGTGAGTSWSKDSPLTNWYMDENPAGERASSMMNVSCNSNQLDVSQSQMSETASQTDYFMADLHGSLSVVSEKKKDLLRCLSRGVGGSPLGTSAGANNYLAPGVGGEEEGEDDVSTCVGDNDMEEQERLLEAMMEEISPSLAPTCL